jgi:amino acid adenylation domain-containing protein
MNIQNHPEGWDRKPGRGPFPWFSTSGKDLHRADKVPSIDTFDRHGGSTIVSLFEHQVHIHPTRPAVEYDGRLTSYHDLNEKAGRLAVYLASQCGVRPGNTVGIMLDRSERLITAMLAVLKAGAVCVPLEPAHPAARHEYIINDAALSLCITERKYHKGTRGCAELILDDLHIPPMIPVLHSPVRPKDLAYIMYTSGSTGKPKGVMIEHRSVVDLALWQWDYFNIDRPRRISQMSSFSFDGSIGECIMALTSGCTLVIIPNEEFLDLIQVINTKSIDIVVTGPAILKQLSPEQLNRRVTIISVGERCPEALYERWRRHCHFVNGYGPTEYSVYSHVWHGTDPIETPVPIGKSRTNLRTYITDSALNLCPVGMAGEILLSGPGLARAYLNSPEQNFRSFIPNRFHLATLFTKRGEIDNSINLSDTHHDAIPESVLSEISREILEKSKSGGLVDDIEHQFDGNLKEDVLRLLKSNESDKELKRAFLRYYLEGKFHTYSALGISWNAFRILMGRPMTTSLKGADLGCGNGELVETLVHNGLKGVTGLDINPYFVRNLTDKGLAAALARIDSPTDQFVADSGIQKESLDFVTSTLTLDRVQYPKQLIRNMSAVLKEGGRLMLGTLLPIVEFEDGDNRSSFAYTRFENKLTPGVDPGEDQFYVIQQLVAAGLTNLEVFLVKIMVNSKNGFQPYDLHVFCGNKDSTIVDDYTRAYRTGDFGRWMADGNIEFIGRMDDQVKIRGHRIELGEAESVLMSHPGIESAVVLAKPGVNEETQLAAFIIQRTKFDVAEIRRWLESNVPSHMIPHVFIFLEEFPLNTSGKIDKSALMSKLGVQAEHGAAVLASQSERDTILNKWNNTAREIPSIAVNRLFEKQALETPDNTAVHFDDRQSLTYRELNERANQLSHFLNKTVRAGDQVGILMEENLDSVQAVIATLKSGCAYVPLDPSYPAARLASMLADGQIRIVITYKVHESLIGRRDNEDIRIICLDQDKDQIEAESSADPETSVDWTELAYVMYTSGTTGVPKKVGVEHRSVVRLVKNTNYWEHGAHQSRILKTGAFAFDASTFEMWAMLLNGGEVFIYRRKQLLDPAFLKEKILHHGIPLLWMTTSWFNQLADIDPEIFKPLRTLLIGGEKASLPHINKVLAACPGLELINCYGPTENTTFSTFYKINGTETDSIPVGAPISNSTVYVLDKNNRLLAPGVDGDVYVGGFGVARGYLNDPDLTSRRFLPDPFRPGERMYMTGDIGRWLDNGMLLLKGRADGQVKVRGHRIEITEVEDALRAVSHVTRAAVLVREHDGQKELLAAFSSDHEIDPKELRKSLTARLPEFMIPSQFCRVHQWPINSNGKLDREKLLHEIAVTHSRTDHKMSLSPVGKELLPLWEESLGQPLHSVDDNFFHVGGDSLLALKLMSRIKARFNISMPVSILFEAPTIHKLAVQIECDLKLKSKDRVNGKVGIVHIQTEGTKPPLFVVPGYLFYHHLSKHLGKDQPVYGFEPVPDLSTEEAAAFYIRQIREVQPEGPYFVGGYCAGGIIAYEIARQLKASGQSVGLLALFETYTSEGVVPKTSVTYLREKILHLKSKFSSSTVSDMLGIVRKELERSLGFAGRYIRGLMGSKYLIQPYRGRIALFIATDGMVGSAKDPYLGWGRYCQTEDLEVYKVPGNHDTMFKEPHVKALADRLSDLLLNARTAVGVSVASVWMFVAEGFTACQELIPLTCI